METPDGGIPDDHGTPKELCEKAGYPLTGSCPTLQVPNRRCPYDSSYYDKCVCQSGLISCPSPQIGVGPSCGGKNINLVNVRAIINLVIADRLWELLLVPLTAKPLIRIVRLVVMIPAQAAIRKPSRAVVMIQRPQVAEIPVIKQKTVVMTLAQADTQRPSRAVVMIQRPQVAERLVINRKPAVMIPAQADIQKLNPVNVMIPVGQNAEIPVIKQNLVRRNGEHVPD